MFVLGSDDGVYRLDAPHGVGEKVLDTDRVMRLGRFGGIDGLFAATRSGLYHSPDGQSWDSLGVPQAETHAVAASGQRLYAGTRPAHVYTCRSVAAAREAGEAAWRDLEGFQALPSRDDWQVSRHEAAQVRDVHTVGSDGLVAGVEVGGVHRSDDGGETWFECREGCDDDIHELRVVRSGEYVAATGHGLFRTSDGGDSWQRLDGDVAQTYFRSVLPAEGVVYASGAMGPSPTWNDPDADPTLFRVDDDGKGDVNEVALPCPGEMVTGMTAAKGAVLAATHRGTVLARDPEGSLFTSPTEGWTVVGELPVPGDLRGRYTPLLWVPE